MRSSDFTDQYHMEQLQTGLHRRRNSGHVSHDIHLSRTTETKAINPQHTIMMLNRSSFTNSFMSDYIMEVIGIEIADFIRTLFRLPYHSTGLSNHCFGLSNHGPGFSNHGPGLSNHSAQT